MEADLQAFLRELSGTCRAFPIHSAPSILSTPDDFFLAVLEGVRSSKQRVYIASLYAGVGGEREQAFLQTLADAAEEKEGLKMHILMDALRSTRPITLPNGTSTSTAESLGAALLHGRAAALCRISLFHSPLLRGPLKQALPPRVREMVGVQHMKAFVFDDTVLLTGANISENYFTNRQDRGMLLRNVPHLADFLTQTIDAVGELSYQLEPTAVAAAARGSNFHPSKQQGLQAADALRSAALRHAEAIADAAAAEAPPLEEELLVQGVPTTALGQSTPSGIDPVRHAWAFSRALRHSLHCLAVPETGPGLEATPLWRRAFPLDYLRRQLERGRAALGSDSRRVGSVPSSAAAAEEKAAAVTDLSTCDTWILPMFQAGFAMVRHEEACTLALLSHAAKMGGKLEISSPYLNLGSNMERALSHAPPRLAIELLTSSPESNGFFGSKGLSGSIPLAYSLLEHRMWQRITRHRSLDRCETVLKEYARTGFEFHAKGIFWTPPGGAAGPVVTSIGSSNFGRRSLRRDLECQFLVVTRDAELQRALKHEWAGLTKFARTVDSAAHFNAPGRRSGLIGLVAVRMLRSFL